jgi:RimJ/RimL family protein N-acetyltransferase
METWRSLGVSVARPAKKIVGPKPMDLVHCVMTSVAPVAFPAPDLDAGPFLLREIGLHDAPAVALATIDSEIPRFTYTPGHMTIDDATKWVQRAIDQRGIGLGARWSIIDRASNEFVGQVGLRIFTEHEGICETFYWVSPTARRKGAASTALRTITDWAFDEQRYRRAQLLVDPDNVASQAVAVKAGYQREGLLRAYGSAGKELGVGRDLVMYAMLPSDRVE